MAGQTNQAAYGHTTGTGIRLTNLSASTRYIVTVVVQDVHGVYRNPGVSAEFETGSPGWQPVGSPGISAGVADSLTLAVCGGKLTLGYADQEDGYRALARQWSGSGWTSLGEAPVSAGAAEGIVIPSGDTVCMLFRDNGCTNRGVVRMYGNEGWLSPDIFSPEAAESLAAVADAGTIYVAFSDPAASGRLAVKAFCNNGWSSVGSNASSGGVDFVSLAVHEGVLYAAFADGDDGWKARVVRYIAGGWETVASGLSGGAVEYLSLVFVEGTPVLALCDGGDGYKVFVKAPDAGGVWTNLGGGAVSSGAGEFSSLGVHCGRPVVAYLDNAAGDKVSVRRFDGSAWVYLGAQGCTPGDVDGLAFTVLHDIPCIAVSDGTEDYKASVFRFNE